jgi:NADPH:quinone reductase-like Zn-dependent oxidoreductase
MVKTVLFHELGGPEVLTLVDEEVRDPGPGEVRIRVEAVGLNRAEALFRTGRYVYPVTRFPARLGTEAAGVLEAVGEGVTGLRPGDPVSVLPGLFSQNDYGVYSELAVVPATAVLRRPEGLGAVEGAAVWMPYLTAYGGLVEVGGMRAGDTVVLNAASSSVGLAAIDVARRTGARAIALTRTAAKKEALLKHGAAEVIVTESEDVAERVHAITDGRGAELVFDAVAGPGSLDLTRSLTPAGLHLVYGNLSGEPATFPPLDLGLPPVGMRTYTVRETATDPQRLRRATAYVASDLEEIVEAHRYLESNGQVGKIVATVGDRG